MAIKLVQLVALVAAAAVAAAHMGISPKTAVAGSREIVSFRIGHDCGDDDVGTMNFTLVIPPRMPGVAVEQVANWKTIITKSVADPPVDTGHGLINETVTSVTYLGFLPDGYYQLFNMRFTLPDTPGVNLTFSGYQECHEDSIAWASIPSEADPEPRRPAVFLELTEELPEEEL